MKMSMCLLHLIRVDTFNSAGIHASLKISSLTQYTIQYTTCIGKFSMSQLFYQRLELRPI